MDIVDFRDLHIQNSGEEMSTGSLNGHYYKKIPFKLSYVIFSALVIEIDHEKNKNNIIGSVTTVCSQQMLLLLPLQYGHLIEIGGIATVYSEQILLSI